MFLSVLDLRISCFSPATFITTRRVWVAVIVFAAPSFRRECFGDGLQWAGCAFITLLGQHKRFEALDFCYHLMRVHEVDQQDEVVSGVVGLGRMQAIVTYPVHSLWCVRACVRMCMRVCLGGLKGRV